MKLEELQNIVTRLTKKGQPPTYRNLYHLPDDESHLEIHSWEEWRKLPTLSREYLRSIPFRNRLFGNREDVREVLGTSGTSGKKPFFTGHSLAGGFEFLTSFYGFKNPVMCSHIRYHRVIHALHESAKKLQTIIIDPRNTRATVTLARAVHADALIIHAVQIRSVLEEMQRQEMTRDIRFICCGGEFSHALWTSLHATFPGATIIFNYGASDVEGIPLGIPCHTLTEENPTPVYHANNHMHLDLIDSETEAHIEPTKGAEGEILVTSWVGEEAVSPLIRYRVGDRIRVVEDHCEKHDTWSFEVLGRSDSDFAKIQGGVLRADEIERVIQKFSDRLTGEFEMHYKEVASENGPKLEATLHVETRSDVDLKVLAEGIASELRIAPTATYSRGVEKGFYSPLVCIPLDSRKTRGKRKRLIKD